MAVKLCLFVLFLGVAHAGFFHDALKRLGHEVKNIGHDLNKVKDIIPDAGKDVVKFVQHGMNFKVQYLDNVNLEGFSWSSCGRSGDILNIESLTVEPDPIHLPGTLQVAFHMHVSQEISSPVDLDLHIKMKQNLIGWIDLPCIDDKGSCNYHDIYGKAIRECPAPFKEHSIPCQCPIPVGDYNLPKTAFPVEHVKIPSFVKKGEFKVKATFSSGGKPVTCVEVEFKLG